MGIEHRRRAAPAANLRRRRDSGEKQTLARAIEDRDLGRRIKGARERKAPAQPGRGRLHISSRPLFIGIAPELGNVGGQYGADEGRNAVLRLADREADGWHPGRHVTQQLPQVARRASGLDRLGRARERARVRLRS